MKQEAVLVKCACCVGSGTDRYRRINGLTKNVLSKIEELDIPNVAILVPSHTNFNGQKYKFANEWSSGKFNHRQINDDDYEIVATIDLINNSIVCSSKTTIIKNIYGKIIIKQDDVTIRELVEYCVKNNISLAKANLAKANLRFANLTKADLRDANLAKADLRDANLAKADLRDAVLSQTFLKNANLTKANLTQANLTDANLTKADLTNAVLSQTFLKNANLTKATITHADLTDADLRGADLSNTKGLVKIMGVERGNYYYKRIGYNLINNNYQFKVGLNTLKEGEVFAGDERATCSWPAFHFASKSWCALHYPNRRYEAKIRIPEDAKINEPWATDGKASADKIEIVQVIDTKTGEDVTEEFRKG